jgi:pyruvate,water dikinase
MLDPFTPLGQDVLAGLVVGVGRRLGAALTFASQSVVVAAAERPYVDITPLLKNAIGRRILPVFIAAVDPALTSVLGALAQDPRLAAPAGRPKLSTIARFAPVMASLAFTVVCNLANPTAGRRRVQRIIDDSLESVARQLSEAVTLADWTAGFEAMLHRQQAILLPILIGMVVSGQAPFQSLLRLAAASLPDGEALALEVSRGLPHNVTTEMDLGLWATAQAIRAEPASREYLARTQAEALALDYQAGRLPPAAQTAVYAFLAKYGVRGVGEIDFGRVRWEEDPAHIFQVLKSYLQLASAEASPEAVFQRGAGKAEAAGRQLVEALRQTPGGWLKARLAAWQISRTRALAGLRETPKYTLVRLLHVFRRKLLEIGQALAAEGRLAHADDVFYLHLDEMKAFAAGQGGDWLALIAERRRNYARELRRRQLPRLLLSDGTAFYEGVQAAEAGGDGTLLGSPVSAGMAEGVAHVVLDPRDARLAPGEILVCPATDPAWTPLFLAAGGLVMEVGGMMTHGSVVAREYGIPAVVGVSQATTRLKTGQRIRMDGSSGVIEILDAESGADLG